MALNKYMHSRNLYKTPPDFSKLAKSFEDFSSVSKTDVTGKVTIDFKDPHSLRVLTKCLLKSDFGLDVDIPEDRLVPTLPLRLNYILWVEDLLNSIDRKDNIHGLDIGTGACAIYPLLAAVNNKWHMIGTESDQESLQKAQNNVERNNLQELIQLSKNSTSTLVDCLFAGDSTLSFDFCMCNPPFYSNVQELCESRSPARLPPKNGFTGSPQELITEGGELTFCRKIIQESKTHKDKILIYTTMVGHKFNLKELVLDLKTDGIKHTTTEFCQGRVTRWGLAWTFQDFDIDKLVPGRDKSRKKNVPVVCQLPELQGSIYNVESTSKKLLQMLQDLKIKYMVLNKKGNQLSLDVQAFENTWSNQRRKRRMMKLHLVESKKPKLEDNMACEGVDGLTAVKIHSNLNNNEATDAVKTLKTGIEFSENSTHDKIDNAGCTNENKESKEIQVENNEVQQEIIPSSSTLNESISLEDRERSEKKNYVTVLVHAFFKLVKIEQNIFLQIEYLDGSAGKEGAHQIMQYIKNNWK